MALLPPLGTHCAKGAICYCLDEFSKGRGARARVSRLRDALLAIAPGGYRGLTEVFDEFLVSHVFRDPDRRARIVQDLNQHWFDPDSKSAYFPGIPVSQIYAEGVLKALEFSLNTQRITPLNAWWIIDVNEFRMLVLADRAESGMTVGGRVTLLVLTPRPTAYAEIGAPRGGRPILGESAQAWISEMQDGQVATHSVREAGGA